MTFSQKKDASRAVEIKAWLDRDQVPIAYKTFHCCNPDCPNASWPDGTRRLQKEEHFNIDGRCRNRS